MAGIRADQLALYTKDMYAAEYEGYKEIETKYDKIYKLRNDVKGAGDKVTQLLGAGDLKRHTVEGEDINYKSPIQGWEFLVKYWTYSDGISLTKESVEDTVKLGNLLNSLANSWGKSVRIAKEEMGSRVFNEGGTLAGDWVFNGTHSGNTDNSGDLLYDSFPLFNLTGNARATKGGGTYFNSVAGLTLTPDNFETIYNRHTSVNNRDERDRVVANPADTLLVYPGADRFQAERIVDTSRGIPNSQLNDKNPYYKLVDVIAWDYLTDINTNGGFYVGKRQSMDFQFHERQRPEIRFFRDDNNRGYKASIDIRIGVLLKNWRVWSRAGGSSS
ncbi:MAG: hypothetical protein GF364_15170 [Candidatus Lokiarchaeota archaeon]|nr:hypothetical protein [Candidatus Lokiarchaeota archaeon]